jgi:hypothetical protein
MPPGSRRIVMAYLWPPMLLFAPMALDHAARALLRRYRIIALGGRAAYLGLGG